MANSPFDDDAAHFARATDTTIQRGKYRRGDLFVEALSAWVPAGMRVLDYGCGPGRLALRITGAGYPVLGVDPSERMIEEARRLAGERRDAEFHVLQPESNGFGSEAWAAIVCSSVIEYVEDDVALLRRFHSWLRPNGVAIVSFANRLSLWRFYGERQHRRTDVHYRLQRHVDTPAAFDRKVRTAGFRPEAAARYFDSPFDRPALRWLGRQALFGTIGLAVLRRTES